jgi:hypothetical protein
MDTQFSNRLCASQFRNAVCSRDQHCVVTKFDICECDACHIIPYSICEKYEWNFINDRRNGILLTKSAHTLFDRFYWTFDIYDIKCIDMTCDDSRKSDDEKSSESPQLSPNMSPMSIESSPMSIGFSPMSTGLSSMSTSFSPMSTGLSPMSIDLTPNSSPKSKSRLKTKFSLNQTGPRYYCGLIISKNIANLTINNYRNQLVEIPIECFPFIYVHYQMYIANNYKNTLTYSEVPKLYEEIIQHDSVFKYLNENEIPVDALINGQFRDHLIKNKIIRVKNRNEYFVNAVTDSQVIDGQEYYKIWWDHYPQSASTLELPSNLNLR